MATKIFVGGLLFIVTCCGHVISQVFAGDTISHSPLRRLPAVNKRPAAKGPALYVDATKGRDDNDGSRSKPWKTLHHAVKQLKAGDTLYLRGGTY
jgi:hypothetical protein